MSKMGICTISSYRGSELYEIIGLNQEVVSELFKFSKTRTEGYGYQYFHENLKIYGNEEVDKLGVGGFYKHKKDKSDRINRQT